MRLVLPTGENFVRARSRFEGMLKDLGAQGEADAYEVYRREGVRGEVTTKTVYYLCNPGPVAEVRRRFQDLLRLRQQLERNLEIKMTRGLWLPAVADSAAGDTQVNVHVSPNWASKPMSAEEIEKEMVADDAAVERQLFALHRQEYRSFTACRRSGSDCRLAICNPMERDGTGKIVGVRILGLNDFCVVLGEIIINYPRTDRHRRKRVDAWRGEDPPLFRFQGRRGQEWEVHPPRVGQG